MKSNVPVLVGALLAGFVGGLGSNAVVHAGSSPAATEPSPQKTITASEFRLVDTDGNFRGRFTVINGQAFFELDSKYGVPKLSMATGPDENTAMYIHCPGDSEISLSSNDGQPAIGISRGRNSVGMVILKSGDTIMDMSTAKMSLKSSIVDDQASIALGGSELYKQQQHITISNLDARPSIQITDSQNRTRAVLGTAFIPDRNGNKIATSPACLTLFDPTGKVSGQMQ